MGNWQVPGEEAMLDISSGGAKTTLAESQNEEHAYDVGLKLAAQCVLPTQIQPSPDPPRRLLLPFLVPI